MADKIFANAAGRAATSVVPVRGDAYSVKRITPIGGGRDGAPVLIFLHEGLGAIGMWKDFPDALADALGCPALIYDRLGHGASGPARHPRGPAYFDAEAHRVLPGLRAACGARDAVLIGHSDGGTIALLHAGRHRVRGLVTAAAHVFVEPQSLAGVAAARAAWRETDLARRLARYHGDQTETMFAAWADMWEAPWFRDWNIEGALADIACPVLALQGEADRYGTPAQLDAIARGVSGPVETALMPDCGHSPHIEAREAMLARVTRFVGNLIGRGPEPS
jgi:pimeloyl-ACP methyl ester carboxylesterase